MTGQQEIGQAGIDATALAAALNELLHAETLSVVAHLHNLAPWAPPEQAELAELANQVIRERLSAIDWLSEQIVLLGRTPRRAVPPMDIASMHYLGYDYLLPRIIRDHRLVYETYLRVLPRLAGSGQRGSPSGSELRDAVRKLADTAAAELALLEEIARRLKGGP